MGHDEPVERIARPGETPGLAEPRARGRLVELPSNIPHDVLDRAGIRGAQATRLEQEVKFEQRGRGNAQLARVTTELNRAANGVDLEVHTADVVGDPLLDVDVVLAGDIWYEPAPSARFRRWFRKLGMPVLTADSGRPYAPRRVRELARYEVPTPFELEARTTRTARVLLFTETRGTWLPR